MNNKLLYIIAALAVILLLISIEIWHQTDLQRIDTLTAENAALHKQVSMLQGVIEIQKQKITELTKALEVPKTPLAQKTSRGGGTRYPLTRGERDLVERVVMAEAGGESYKGQMLVAQCILNACEIDGIRPAEVIRKYVYAKARPEPSDSVKQAVSAVFDKGEQVTDEPIVYFYAPARVKSKFHESQIFCVEEGGHRFFAQKSELNSSQ